MRETNYQLLYSAYPKTIKTANMKYFNSKFSAHYIRSMLLIGLCLSSSSYAKDAVTFNCEAVGFGYQGGNTSGPWEHKLGSFTWHYDASMLSPEPPILSGKRKGGCKPVDIESPKILLEKGKSVFISANRCGDHPSYFSADLTTDNYSVSNSLGYVDQVLKNKEIRIVIRGEKDTKISNNNKEFSLIYFDCHSF